MTISDKILCCAIVGRFSCMDLAEWIIVSGPTDSDVTYACTDHVGTLLNDADEQRIYPIRVDHD